MSMCKLIIITSKGHDEFNNYWNSPNIQNNNVVVINRRTDGNNNGEENDIVKGILNCNDKNVMVLIHEANQIPYKETLTVNGNKIECQFCYYSTQMGLSDLWSFGAIYNGNNGGHFNIPKTMPTLPMDKLCWALKQNTPNEAIIKEACNEIIDYFKKKIIYANRLEQALDALHKCLAGSKPNGNDFSYYNDDEKRTITDEIGKLHNNPNEKIETFEAFRDKILEMAEIE
jgi:hypothetical protein